MRRISIIALLLAALLAAPLSGARGESGEESDLTSAQSLRRGVELYNAGQSEEALSRLRGFVVRHGGSPLLPEAYLYLARIFRDTGQYGEALLYLDRIAPERQGVEARLIRGAALIGAGKDAEGVEILLDLPDTGLSPEDRRLRLSALAEGNSRLGRPLAALLFIHRSLSLPGTQETESLLQQAHILMRDRLSDAELGEAAFMFGATPLGEDARLQQALRAFARGDGETARTLAQGIVRSTVPFPYRRDAVLLLERLMGGEHVERTVGVVLPLSGRYATFGGLVRRGIELAQQVHSDSGVNFVFTDTDADPKRTAQAVSELSREQRVIGIIGPLTGGAAAAAADRAQKEKVPLLTLSQREGIPETGDHIFRSSLTAAAQVEALVSYAMQGKGLSRFAVLAPENRLGQEMGELFAREVQRRGGQIVGRQSYPENATDFRTQVRLLQGRDPKGADPKPGQHTAPFQSLFIPDYADRIALIAPQLAYYGLEGIQLLGINGWNSPDLVRQAGRFVEGAVFVDGFFRSSPNPVVREFVHLYQEKYGEEPSILEAQGFDAANMILSLLSDPALRTRDDLRKALSGLEKFPGVTGETSFDSRGEARKDLFLLQVRDKEIVQVD